MSPQHLRPQPPHASQPAMKYRGVYLARKVRIGEVQHRECKVQALMPKPL